MASNRARANAVNARRSTGPRTPDGRRRAALNRLDHGLRAATPVLPGEDPAELDRLRARLTAELQPVGVVEEFLVERATLIVWRLRRAERVERGVFLDRLLDLEVERADRDRRRHERTFADGLAALDATITDPAAHAEAAARLAEAEALREEELPTLGAAFARADGPGGLDPVGRYEAAAERSLLRVLRELRDRRAARGASS